MKKIRKFLKRNQILLNTSSSILLSLMAIIVSVKSCDIADKQYQSDFFDKLPEFEIIQSQVRNPINNNFEETVLNISKTSGKAKNIEIDMATFFNINYTIFNDYNSFSFIVPDYYNINYNTGKIDGEIQEAKGIKNQKTIYDFQNQLDSLITSNHYINSKLTTYVKITYLNFENKKTSNYYEVDFMKGNYIDSIIGKKKFEEYNNLYKSETIIDFSNPNALEKLKYMTKNFKKQN